MSTLYLLTFYFIFSFTFASVSNNKLSETSSSTTCFGGVCHVGGVGGVAAVEAVTAVDFCFIKSNDLLAFLIMQGKSLTDF